MASPGIGDGAIERFTVRFNQARVPLGDPRAAAPFAVKCPVEGQGRWVDQTTFVHEFSKPLPGGVTCSFHLRDDLKSLSGYARSEEPPSELQSIMRISYSVFILKKTTTE